MPVPSGGSQSIHFSLSPSSYRLTNQCSPEIQGLPYSESCAIAITSCQALDSPLAGANLPLEVESSWGPRTTATAWEASTARREVEEGQREHFQSSLVTSFLSSMV